MAQVAPSASPHPPSHGLFGPGSRMWHVNREAVLLGAGPAALLLQIAHPLVAEGVAAHSRFEADPMGRLRRTLGTTLGMVFGDDAVAGASVARLNRIHARVFGEVHDAIASEATGASDYRALDPQLLLWVQATLSITSVQAYRAWVGPISEDEAAALWQESRALGRQLGIPDAASPRDWLGLLEWFDAQLGPGGPVRVTPTARAIARTIVRPPLPLAPGWLVDVAMLPGLGLLPASLRADFGIAWSARHERTSRWLGRGIRAWTSLLPRGVRAMPQARAAERRVRSTA